MKSDQKKESSLPQIDDEDGYKLWYFCFQTEVPLYVLAKTHEEADQIAKDHIDEEANKLSELWSDDFTRWPVRDKKMITSEWIDDHPYDGRDEPTQLTIAQIVEAYEERHKLDPLPNQEPLPGVD